MSEIPPPEVDFRNPIEIGASTHAEKGREPPKILNPERGQQLGGEEEGREKGEKKKETGRDEKLLDQRQEMLADAEGMQVHDKNRCELPRME